MKKTYELKLTLKSPALIGSGEGFGSIIDSDIVFDDLGIPYIPSKRIKGCLRDSALEICEMFEQAGIQILSNSNDLIAKIFGTPGQENPASVFFSNLMIKDYKTNSEWLEYLMSKNEYKDLIRRDPVIDYFTELRQQTEIDEGSGTAKEHSLRTIRVAKRELDFIGIIEDETNNSDAGKLLFFASKNLRRFGTKRNRGFGEIECTLMDNSKVINYITELEALCRQ